MNPALAFSIQFPCSGHSFLEYAFVFWLGPILGNVCPISWNNSSEELGNMLPAVQMLPTVT